MLQLKTYQQEAVTDLSSKLFKLLKLSGVRHNLVFKAPTGAGKTLMMANLLERFSLELPSHHELTRKQVSFIWIAPNKLHKQSYKSLEKYFAETRQIKAIYYEDVSGELLPNEVLFVNWESINKEKNAIIRENENNKNLYTYINRARQNNIEIIVIIDEEHMFASAKTAKRATEVLKNIYAKVEIRVSATPTTPSDYKTTVERQDVIAEEMIKNGIYLNPALHNIAQNADTLDALLITEAITKREAIKLAYEQVGSHINPLLLIQLPNDVEDKNTTTDNYYTDLVKANLAARGISVGNGKLAVWLSGVYDNVDGIEAHNNMVEILLFKQAIALGWDCPRAAVLLIFRDLKSTTFTIQTVGRILRMPEQKHYSNSLLNFGYVYTNLSKDMISVVKDDMNYITSNEAKRIDNYLPVALETSIIERTYERNNLSSDFKKEFSHFSMHYLNLSNDFIDISRHDINKKKLQEKMVNINVDKINITIPEDIFLTGGEETQSVSANVRFAKTADEVKTVFNVFCRNNLGGFAVGTSYPMLESALVNFFEFYLGFAQHITHKIVLANQAFFIELIEKAIDEHAKNKVRKTKSQQNKTAIWEVPNALFFTELYESKLVEKYALNIFYESKEVSAPEKNFVVYLQENKDYIEWWYKNGDKGQEHFAVLYKNNLGDDSLFYVDFVIYGKNNVVYLFDTKTPNSDPEAPNKHNALVDFIENHNEKFKAKGLKTVGGILIEKVVNNISTWRYCKNRIENTTDLTGWEFLKMTE